LPENRYYFFVDSYYFLSGLIISRKSLLFFAEPYYFLSELIIAHFNTKTRLFGPNAGCLAHLTGTLYLKTRFFAQNTGGLALKRDGLGLKNAPFGPQYSIF